MQCSRSMGSVRCDRRPDRDWRCRRRQFMPLAIRRILSEPVMAAVTFTPPKQWDDWCDWALGSWLILSPWTLLFEQDTVATRNAVTVGFLVVAAEALTLSMFRVWEEWINVALGAWLVVSPWVLGVSSAAAKVNFVLVGLVVVALALYEVRETQRNPDDVTSS